MRTRASSEALLSTVTPSKAIVKLAIPATIALLAKAVYNIVDTAYIGLLGDDVALAAVGVTLPLLLITLSVQGTTRLKPCNFTGFLCYPQSAYVSVRLYRLP